MGLYQGTVPNDSKNANACKNLYGAVLLQAFEDAAYVGRKPECIVDRDHARAWLTSVNYDLHFICDCAGLEPRAVLTKARSQAAQGWPPLEIPGGMKYEQQFLTHKW